MIRNSSSGKVISLRGPLVIARLPDVAVGDLCFISRRNRPDLMAQVVSFEGDFCFLAPYDDLDQISPDAEVKCCAKVPFINVGKHLIGKIIDPMGRAFNPDGSKSSETELDSEASNRPLKSPAPNPLLRHPVNKQFCSGIKSIDLFTPLGYGQRIGLFAAPGVGKSTLLGMLARNADIDLTVIALVGERGREVNEFINEALGPEGLKKAILVVSTSDESPLRRVMAAESATAIAEHFRAKGMRVLLLVDSLTRVARAIRDVALASGELPLRQGYTPTVYSQLPRLLERAGNSQYGSITAIYTILTQNDVANDALGEEAKSLLDGHIVLSSELANQGIRPAIDIVNSISRCKHYLQSNSESAQCLLISKLISRIQRDKDIILMGGQADPELQTALLYEEQLKDLLRQRTDQSFTLKQSLKELKDLAGSVQPSNLCQAE